MKMNKLKNLNKVFLNYLRSKLTRIQYIILVAILVGLVSGLLAVLLKSIVHYIQRWVEQNSSEKYAYLGLPIVGLLLTVLVIRYFFGGKIEKGIAMVLKSIARKSSFIPLKHTYLHVVTSSITVGLGGSVGLEAPIVATGSAVGSNLSRVSDLNYQERSLLIACGAAAGISAVFNAPYCRSDFRGGGLINRNCGQLFYTPDHFICCRRFMFEDHSRRTIAVQFCTGRVL